MRPNRFDTQSAKLRSGRIGKHLDPEARQQHTKAGPDAKVAQRVQRFQRVIEEAAAIVNAREAGTPQEILPEHLTPDSGDRTDFREKPVAADVESKSFVLDGARKAADVAVLFEDDDGDPACGQFIAGGEACGACTDNNARILADTVVVFPSGRRDSALCNSEARWPSQSRTIRRLWRSVVAMGGDLSPLRLLRRSQ